MTRFSFETSRRIGINAICMKMFVALGALLLAAACTAASSVNGNSAASSPASSSGSTPAPAPPPSAPSPPSSGSASVLIRASQTSCIAPCGVFLSATASGFKTARPFHELSYGWDFGDTGATFSALASDFPFGNDANSAIGANAAHIFAAPGDYLVKATAALPGVDSAAATVSIHVDDPDAAFSGGNTTCYSRVGDFVGCPAGARQLTDFTAAMGAIGKGGRLLLRAGETTQVTQQYGVTAGPAVISRFGAGSDPVLRADAVFTRMLWIRGASNVAIDHVSFMGGYDAITGLGKSPDAGVVASGNAKNVTLFRNSFSGLGLGAQSLAFEGGVQGYVIADNSFTNWWNFGVLITNDQSNTDIALTGNSIKQKAGAVSGPGAKGWSANPSHTDPAFPNYADHGPVRIAYTKTFAAAQNDVLSLTGWSADGRDHQSPFRYMTDGGDAFTGAINRNRFSGGYDSIEMVCANVGDVAGLGDIVIERNDVVMSDNTRVVLYTAYAGTTLRNNIAHRSAVALSPPMRVIMMLEHQCPKSPENMAAPLDFASNTFIDLRLADGHDDLIYQKSDGSTDPATSDFAALSLRNNIFYAPNAANSGSFVNQAPIDLSTFAPIQPSAAYKSASPDTLVFDDFYGTARGVSTNKGAID